jgi:hypothetical protein
MEAEPEQRGREKRAREGVPMFPDSKVALEVRLDVMQYSPR